MADKQLEREELNDQDDDLPILIDDDETTDQEGVNDSDDSDDSGDEYDIRAEMDDSDNHVLGLLTDEELAALDEAGEDEVEEDEPGSEPEPVTEQTAEAEDDTAQDPAPQAQSQSFELTQEQIDQINEASKAARQEALDKWRDGDLTDEELQEAIDAADQAKEQARLDALDEARQREDDQAFEVRKASFVEDARTYLTKDYPDLAKPEHLAEFDRHVRSVTASARFEGKSNREMLEAAHRLYAAEAEVLGIAVPALKGAAKSAAKPAPKATEPAKKPKPEVVPTLARVPAAATNSAADGKWGSVAARYAEAERNGDVDGMERIMKNLSDEEREAFASMDI